MYSAFSERSPSAAASPTSRATFGRSTDHSRWNSSRSRLSPSGVITAVRGGRAVGLRLMAYPAAPAVRRGGIDIHLLRNTIALCVLLLAAWRPAAGDEARLVLATTTSVQDSGLLDALLPVFRERTGIAVQVVAVGSGAALRMGAEGNADVILSHDPKGEQELVASGAAIGRTPIMENYFVIAGPKEDPAKVAQAADPLAAYRAIAAAKAPYVSRGDDSGTHRKEKQLLAAAGIDAAKPWEGFA